MLRFFHFGSLFGGYIGYDWISVDVLALAAAVSAAASDWRV